MFWSLMTINCVVCSIEESKDLDENSLKELKISLRVHKQKLIKQDQEEQEALSNNTLNNQTRKIKEKLVAKETKMVDSHTFKDYLF